MRHTVRKLLSKCNRLGVSVKVDHGRLKIVTNNSVEDELLQELKAQKQEILDYLKGYQTANEDGSYTKLFHLSSGQKSIWLSSAVTGAEAKGMFHIPMFFNVYGELDIDNLEDALNAILKMHKILGSVFIEDGENIYQGFQENVKIKLGGNYETVVTDDLSEIAKKEFHKKFSLKTDIKLRASLYKTGNEKYLLMFVFHHIVFDGTSANIFVKDLAMFYDKLKSNGAIGATDFGWEYFEYANLETVNIIEKDGVSFKYWENKLKKIPSIHSFPLDIPRASIEKRTVATIERTIDSELVNSMNKYAAHTSSTVSVIFQAAFALLIARYGNTNDVVIGTPSSRRNKRELENVIGLFLNNIILRYDINLKDSFQKILDAAKSDLADALEHQEVSFEHLVKHFSPQRSQSYSPLFQIMFVMQAEEKQEIIHLDGVQLQAIKLNVGGGYSEFDIVLNIYQSNGSYVFSLLYDESIFFKRTMKRMLANLERLLTFVIKNDSLPVGKIPLSSKDEREEIWERFSKEEKVKFGIFPIQLEFEKRCMEVPNKIAVIFRNKNLTYTEFNNQANQLAHYIRKCGVSKQGRVGLYIEKSIDIVVAMLAVLKAGAVFLPLDQNTPIDRIKYILRDSCTEYVITKNKTINVEGVQIIDLDVDKSKIRTQKTSNMKNVYHRFDYPAYIMYTSGSTGRPKGVEVNHFGVLNLTRWQYDYYGCNQDFVVSQLASFSFDASIGESFMAMLNGLTLVMIDQYSAVHEIEDQIKSNRVNIIVTVPSMLNLFSSDALKESELDVVVSVGEVMPEEIYRIWSKNYRLFNGYGPTEYTVYSHACYLNLHSNIEGKIPVGNAVYNTRTSILDQEMNPVPIGVEGDIYISGAGIANGYISKTRMNNSSFLIDTKLVKTWYQHKKTGHRGDWYMPHNDHCLFNDQYEVKQKLSMDYEEKVVFLKQLAETSPEIISDQTLQFATNMDEHEFGCFFRYLLEGMYNTYDSIGLSKEMMIELYEGFDFRGKRGVDFCCGNGRSLAHFKELGAEVIGLDFSPSFVHSLNKRGFCAYLQKVDDEYEQFFKNLKFDKHSMDFVFSSLTLDRVACPKNFMENFLSVLVENASFCLLTILPICPVDDGDSNSNFVYTHDDHRITPGKSEEEDINYLVRELRLLGAREITIKKIPYSIKCKDGYMKYWVWSFSGRYTLEAGLFSEEHLYSKLYKTGDRGKFTLDGGLVYLGREDELLKINGVRIELGEIKSRLLAIETVKEALVIARENNGHKQLVAYLQPSERNTLSEHDLITSCRRYLKSKLSDYMMPTGWVVINEWPLLVSGKVDRNALPALNLTLQNGSEYIAPSTEQEKILCAIWSDVLGIDQVGVTDNFFEIGGDSILSIQLVSRARKHGLGFEIRDIFEHQTISELCPFVTSDSQVLAPQEILFGTVPLHPIQKLFFQEGNVDYHHFNQSMLLSTPKGFSIGQLKQIVRELYLRHDALRLRYIHEGEDWQGEYLPLTNELVEASCIEQQVLMADEDIKLQVLQKSYNELQSSLSLSGPLLKAGYFDLGGGQGQLLIIIHHLVIDGVSWRIILNDLETAYEQLLFEDRITLEPKSSSYAQWCQRLYSYLESEELESEGDYWDSHINQDSLTSHSDWLPIDHGNMTMLPRYDQLNYLTLELSKEDTERLLRESAQAYRTQVQELLLAGVYLALCDWSGETQTIAIDIESHGRESLFEDLDTGETIGWFTSLFPQIFNLDKITNLEDVIKHIKEQYRKLPNHGIGYGVLSYLSTNSLETIDKVVLSPLVFNYLGQFGQSKEEEDHYFQRLPGSKGQEISGYRTALHLLSLNGLVTNGQLRFTLSYSQQHFVDETITKLAKLLCDSWRRIINHCCSAEAGSYTPSDFPHVQLTQEEVSSLESIYPSLESIYYATPMQAGMLFHSLFEAGTGLYVTQLSFEFDHLDVSSFKEAWYQVILRHEALRAAFVGMESESLRQLIVSDVTISWHEADCSGLKPLEQEELYQEYLSKDQAKGFDYQQPPLMRFALWHLGEEHYQFLWTCHHALLDGWSNPLIWQDLSTIYTALVAGQKPSLPTAPRYAHYMKWLSVQDRDKARIYWRDQLAWVEEPMPLGIEEIRATGNDPIEEIRLELSRKETDQLRNLSQHTHTTLNTIFLGAWSYLLHCYSGNQQVLFGTTVSGRPGSLVDVDKMVGLFINTLPFSATVDPYETVWSWLQDIQSKQVEREAYGYLALPEIQKLSSIHGGKSLFGSVVIYENFPALAQKGEDQSFSSMTGKVIGTNDFTNYDLTAVVIPQDKLYVKLQYRTERFRADTIERLRSHLYTILLNLSDAMKQTRIRELSLLSEQEQHQLIVASNDTQTDYQKERCIHELFEAQAIQTPDRTALVFEEETLSYDELNNRANRLAHYLRDLGVSREELIGLCFERGFELIVSMLGILKAGCAYVPMDPNYPKNRLEEMIADSGVRFIVTHESAAEKVSDTGSELITVDMSALAEKIVQYSTANIPVTELALTSSNLAYVIYTSGSTGKPKGVMIEHQGLVNFIESSVNKFSLHQETVWLALTTISFDISYLELFSPLTLGAQVVLLDESDKLNINRIQDVVETYDVNVVQATPTYWSWLLEQNLQLDSEVTALCGGEAISAQLTEKLIGRFGGFYNCYGPTEATIWSLVKAIGPSDKKVSIGNPIANLVHYVVDRQNKLVATGLPGELLIGGPGLARGYLNRPELTEEKFIKNPFHHPSISRVYRTGDLVHCLPDTGMEFLGRIDHQVKIRGFRIELCEIESRLSMLNAVKECLVMVQEDHEHKKHLIAYLLRTEDCVLLDSDFITQCRENLKASLPDYMVPTGWVLLSEWPLLPNGKINRNALPAADATTQQRTEYMAPQTEHEKILCNIWAKVLGVERVGITDNFFDLGGDSLSSLRIISEIERALYLSLDLKIIFDCGSLKSLSASIDQIWQKEYGILHSKVMEMDEAELDEILNMSDVIDD